MGNSLNSTSGGGDSRYEYVKQARTLVKNQAPRKGGDGFNQWGVSIIRKQKRGKVSHVSYRVLGACGQYFDMFFRPLLPEITEITEDLLKGGLSTDSMPFERAKAILDSYKSSKPKHLEVKLVVVGETSPDSIKFQNQVEMQDRTAVIIEPGSTKLAVFIGPLMLQWEKNGLVVPRLFEPFNALCILDMKSKLPLSTETLMKISEACCHFNKYYEYSPFLMLKQANEATSHAFAWLIIKETLGIKEFFPPGGAIDHYLKNLLVAEEMICFKGFSFTSNHQVSNFFRKHCNMKEMKKKKRKKGKCDEEDDIFELFAGFKDAFAMKEKVRKKREERRKQYEQFRELQEQIPLDEMNPAFIKGPF